MPVKFTRLLCVLVFLICLEQNALVFVSGQVMPSMQPSAQPSGRPTGQPSGQPTGGPRMSTPTLAPTLYPTTAPAVRSAMAVVEITQTIQRFDWVAYNAAAANVYQAVIQDTIVKAINLSVVAAPNVLYLGLSHEPIIVPQRTSLFSRPASDFVRISAISPSRLLATDIALLTYEICTVFPSPISVAAGEFLISSRLSSAISSAKFTYILNEIASLRGVSGLMTAFTDETGFSFIFPHDDPAPLTGLTDTGNTHDPTVMVFAIVATSAAIMLAIIVRYMYVRCNPINLHSDNASTSAPGGLSTYASAAALKNNFRGKEGDTIPTRSLFSHARQAGLPSYGEMSNEHDLGDEGDEEVELSWVQTDAGLCQQVITLKKGRSGSGSARSELFPDVLNPARRSSAAPNAPTFQSGKVTPDLLGIEKRHGQSQKTSIAIFPDREVLSFDYGNFANFSSLDFDKGDDKHAPNGSGRDKVRTHGNSGLSFASIRLGTIGLGGAKDDGMAHVTSAHVTSEADAFDDTDVSDFVL
jgi:hypothetical protein